MLPHLGGLRRPVGRLDAGRGTTRRHLRSVDVPILVDLPTPLMDLPFPQRLIDVLGNRMSIDSYTFEYYQQTARVNEAAPVADLALKPTSTFTVEAVSGRAQIIATLSQPCPVRIYWHFQDIGPRFPHFWFAFWLPHGIVVSSCVDAVRDVEQVEDQRL